MARKADIGRFSGVDGGEGEEVSEQKIEFWDCSEDSEILSYENENDAIEYYLDDYLHALPIAEWPEKITLYGFVRETLKLGNEAARILEQLLEGLDEEYGNPEKATTETEGMKKAAEEFVQKVAAEYQVWSCKRVASEEINVMEWVKEHCPQWLTENPQLVEGRG
jgi:hypothetical protein